jgi:hypothetical protein
VEESETRIPKTNATPDIDPDGLNGWVFIEPPHEKTIPVP